jgi:predicted dehydrogenase
MIDREDLDIVEILTPHHLHCPMTEYAAKAGISGISLQKPMAHTISDCDKIIQVCKEEKVKLKLFENFRFYPVYLHAKELLNRGIIGEPLNFRIVNILTAGPSMMVDLSAYKWRTNVDTCGGGPEVFDDGQHKLSMALWLMDEERVEELYGWIDYFTGVIDAPANIIWKYPSKEYNGPQKFGTIEFTYAANLYYPSNYYGIDEFIEISGKKGIMWINQCTAGGNFLSKATQYPPIVVYVDGKVRTYGNDLPRDWRYSFINSTEHFIDVIDSGKGEPIYTGEQGKNLCVFGKMPYLSYQQKRIVYWSEFTAENEKNRTCVVEPPQDKPKGLTKYYMRKSKDMKKGLNQGLNHNQFKFEYDL